LAETIKHLKPTKRFETIWKFNFEEPICRLKHDM
jgi:hypothetical protein